MLEERAYQIWSLALWTVVRHPLAEALAAVLLVMAIGFFGRLLARWLKALGERLWHWATPLFLGVTALAEVYRSVSQSSEVRQPLLRWATIAAASVLALKEGYGTYKQEKHIYQQVVRNLLVELAREPGFSEHPIRAKLMVLRDGWLDLRAASDGFHASYPRFELGQGVCGVVAERGEPVAVSLDAVADANQYEDIVDREHFGTPWRLTRDQWVVFRGVRSILSVPIHSGSGRVVAVLDVESGTPLEQSSFTSSYTRSLVQTYAKQIEDYVSRTGWL